MPRKRTSRLRARKQGGATKYDGDFRDYTVVGSGIEALKPAGSKWATTDPDVATRLITQRLQQLEKSKRSLDVLGLRETGFTESLAHHADPKAQTTEATCQWLEAVEGYLHAGATSGARAPGPTSDSEPQRVFRSLDSITTREVQRFIARLRKKDGKRGSKVSASSVREYSNSLSNLFRRAESEGCVPPEPASHRRT
jgi:hypothetical protein